MELGLTTTEAKLLAKKFGTNTFAQPHSFHYLTALMGQIFSVLNMLLIVAAVISIVIKDYTDATLILTIVILNAAISFWQEYKAEKTLEELKRLSPTFSRVIRDGKEVQLSTDRLVPGDVVLLEVGDKIPADGIVIEALNFEVNESALTGESAPVYKKPDEAEHNQVFGSTIAAAGRAKVRISTIGEFTRFGKIAKTLQEVKEVDTPLQKQIKKLALSLAGIAVVLSTIIYFAGIMLGFSRLEMFFTAVSSAVALVPEGLPSILLITMAVGVKRMAQKRAVVRKLIAIEGLGSVNVICTDKTGTLTLGQMQVQKIWMNDKMYDKKEFKHQLRKPTAKRLLDSMIVANTASLTYKLDGSGYQVLGDSTEGCLLVFAQEIGVNYDPRRKHGSITDEFSFDQTRKSMSVVWYADNEVTALAKSAPEFMLEHSNRISTETGVKNLTETEMKKLVNTYRDLAAQGYRVLGFGYKTDLPLKEKYDRNEVESNLVFLGFAALMDPLRKEAAAAIKTAAKAGIRSLMITGDNELTAGTIARQLGLTTDAGEVMLGRDVERLSEEELMRAIQHVKVFARTNPEHKLKIVKAFQKSGFAVAVTGDGVNDALALKQAEIGVAMGRDGTDVAKEAADIVLTDDNYATIIGAIEEGRTIYDNVVKAIRYLLSTNIGEILTILLALAFGLPAPLLPAQILWTNLVSDGLPALALAVDPKDSRAMENRPRHSSHTLFSGTTLVWLIGTGVVVSGLTLVAYWLALSQSGDLAFARTVTFTTLICLQMIVAIAIQIPTGKINYNLIGAIALTLLIQFIILSTPALYPIFEIKRIF